MYKIKEAVKIILALTILFYLIIVTGFRTEIYAVERTRTEDLSNLENYKQIYTSIQELKTSHPNWTFTILYTGLDWNTVLENQTTKVHTRSLVHKSLVSGNVSEWVCSVCGTAPKDNGSWYCASNKTASYYIDPRNWLNETYIFAFETLSFNGNVHTVDGVETILKGTFMEVDTIKYLDTKGKEQTINKSYAEIIYEAGKKFNVSPYHLAARVRQEQGGTGNSSLITGDYIYTNPESKEETNYTGYYNYFNIAASGSSSTEIVVNGLEKAKAKGWTTPELAIYGGAEFLSNGYIGQYQDSLYLQKYHVDSASKYSLYSHQYQQNVSAPYTENLEVYNAYEELGILDSNFNFIIPVYENMPENACEKPGRKVSIQTEDVVVKTETTPLSIRSSPYVGDNIKAKAPKGTTLVRIEKAEELSSDERYWDKVVYNTGTKIVIGYASREYLEPVETKETIKEEETVEKMCNLRAGPSTSTAVKKVLDVGTKVTIIDKMTYKTYNHTWFRVKLEDGTQGYVSSVYLDKEQIVGKNYRINGDFVIIAPGTEINDIEGAKLITDKLGTGAKVSINDKEYSLVILGDVSGDGEIKSKDYMMIKNSIMGTLELTDIEKKAADVNKDTEIKSKDYMMIKNFIMGTSKITL